MATSNHSSSNQSTKVIAKTLKAHPSGYPTLLPWGIPTEDRTLNIRHCNETKVAQALRMSEGNCRTLRKCHTGSRGMRWRHDRCPTPCPVLGNLGGMHLQWPVLLLSTLLWLVFLEHPLQCSWAGLAWENEENPMHGKYSTPDTTAETLWWGDNYQHLHLPYSCRGMPRNHVSTGVAMVGLLLLHQRDLWKAVEKLGQVCKVTSRHPIWASCSTTLFGKDCFAQPSRSPWFHAPMHWLETGSSKVHNLLPLGIQDMWRLLRPGAQTLWNSSRISWSVQKILSWRMMSPGWTPSQSVTQMQKTTIAH